MQIKDINKRTKKAVIHNIEKLIQKYGIEKVRLVCNKYFVDVREKANLQKEIETRERELEKLKRKKL